MKIQLFAICVVSVFCVGYGTAELCSDDVLSTCSATGGTFANCNAKYGAFKGEDLMSSVQQYAREHIQRSFQFLLMSSYFGNYVNNRAGLEKLYRKFSDETWEKSIDLVKYLSKRGGHMTFELTPEENLVHMNVDLHELASLGKALDMQKKLAEKAHSLHADVTRKKEHDAELASYLENNFVHQQADVIRTLSGHSNDLKHLLANEEDPSLALYLFDEYIKNSL